MVLSTLVWRVWSLVAMFWNGEIVGMKAQSNSDFICELKTIKLSSLEFLSFRLMIFLMSLVLDMILSLMCSRCCLQESLGSSLMPRNVGNGSRGIGAQLIFSSSLQVCSQFFLLPAGVKTVQVVLLLLMNSIYIFYLYIYQQNSYYTCEAGFKFLFFTVIPC